MDEQKNEITLFIEGGMVHDIQGLPENTKIIIVDYDIDGADEEFLEEVGDRMAYVKEW